MKRKLAILLVIVCLMTALLPACQKKREPTPTLRIVTNVGFQDEQLGGEDDLKSVIEHFGGLPEGTEIEQEVLPLDELKDSAKHMDWEVMNEKVMAAGQSEEGQMLLPLFYGCAMARTDEQLGEIPGSWDEAAASSDKAVRECYGAMLARGALRDLALGDVADYESEALLITEEELSKRVKEALALVDMMASREFLSMEPFWSERRMLDTVSMFLFTMMSSWNGGVPIYDDYFEDGRTLNFEYSLPEYREDVYREMLESISDVYIPTSIDQELIMLFNDCKAAGSEAEIDKLVSDCYSTMKMILA